jgi:acetylglutamate kinase
MIEERQMQKYIDKINVLSEAVPYIKEFRDKCVVVKYGGSAMVEENLKLKVIQDIILMKYMGIRPVIVHGGGSKISSHMKKLGKEAVFIDGIRITDKETMEITEMVLTGHINQELVSLINTQGGSAIGLSGKDGKLIVTKKKDPVMSTENKLVDYGFVGNVVSINTDLLDLLDKNGFIPVISPVGFGENGESHNLNADTLACHVAAALKAEKLILLTDVEGILDKDKKLISSITEKDVKRLIDEKVISGGMIPKVKAGFFALDNGVNKVHVIDGRIEHSILLELFTDAGIGTQMMK